MELYLDQKIYQADDTTVHIINLLPTMRTVGIIIEDHTKNGTCTILIKGVPAARWMPIAHQATFTEAFTALTKGQFVDENY